MSTEDFQFAKETLPVDLTDEMEKSYLDYAMSVIVGRALPDVRDGLKPVHRRSLFAMSEMGNDWNKPYKKSARIVGDVIGKYHPHGDTAVYDTIVRLAQGFSMRYPLVDGQGNFGSIDGDGAAAMRYTEVRMAKIATQLLVDLDKETVDFGENYDGSLKEPLVLPSRIPNLLVNGSSGIAVGMATNIPPHNLSQTIDACLALLRRPDITPEEIVRRHLPAPDFPTGGIIFGLSGVREGYLTGRGRIVIRAKTHIEPCGARGEREAIIVDEIPYQVNKAKLCEKIAKLVRDKTIEGVQELRDESDKSGMRIAIELKRNENAAVILNKLFKLTDMQYSFGMNMVALVDGRPRVLNIKEILAEFLRHRNEVVTRRVIHDLRKARERAHILEGLAVALSNVDEMIAIIKSSPTPPEAKQRLTERVWPCKLVEEMMRRIEVDPERFRPEGAPALCGAQEGGYKLTESQAQAILDMRLQRLTGLERDKITGEYAQVAESIADYLDVLSKKERIVAIVEDELKAVKEEFGDARRTAIDPAGGDIPIEELIAPQEMIVTASNAGYIKSQPAQNYAPQKRGGKGKIAASTREEDFIVYLFGAHTHDSLLFFTDRGRCFCKKVYELPEGSRNGRGRPINNVVDLAEGESVTALLPVQSFGDERFVLMATANGTVKRCPLKDFSRIRAGGLKAIGLAEGDTLVRALETSGHDEVFLFSSDGKALRFSEGLVRAMGRTARGVRGMKLGEGQKIVDMIALDPHEDADKMIIVATEKGYGKRCKPSDFPLRNRGGQGVLALKRNGAEKAGSVVAAVSAADDDDLMLIASGGVLIRTQVNQVRETGRSAIGVRLINLAEGETLASIERISEYDFDAARGETAERPADDSAQSEGGATSDAEAEAGADGFNGEGEAGEGEEE